MNTRMRTALGLGIALALAAGGASATNGYYMHGMGTKSKGQAGAGSADLQEILVMATNPAGMVVPKDTVTVELAQSPLPTAQITVFVNIETSPVRPLKCQGLRA